MIVDADPPALGNRALAVQFNPRLFSATEALLGIFVRKGWTQTGEETDALKEVFC